MKNLGALFDQALSQKDHVNRLIRLRYYQFRRIKSVCRVLPTSTANQLVNSFIVSCVDYCNSLLWGAPANLTDGIRSVLHVAARLIYGRRHFDHVTDLMRDRLHWLQAWQWIAFKCILLTYKAQHELVPA